jgi:hypothetical protein
MIGECQRDKGRGRPARVLSAARAMRFRLAWRTLTVPIVAVLHRNGA